MNLKSQKRNCCAFNLRQEGTSFKEIGRLLGVSGERARQLVSRYKRRHDQLRVGTISLELAKMGATNTVRIMNRLSFYFDKHLDEIHPKHIAQIGARKLLKIRNLGEKSIKELAWALESLGTIEDANMWLDEKCCPACGRRPHKGSKNV